MKLRVKDIVFSYTSTPILEEITMELSASEMLGIVGPNGAGKSTLIRCINRILKPEQGSIHLDGQEIREMVTIEIAKHLGYVPQSFTGVFPATVFDTILVGRRPHIGWRSSESDEDKVWAILEMMAIEDLAMRDFNELSGGQQQRVGIARALMQEPEMILADEPVASLDPVLAHSILEHLEKLNQEEKITIICSLHYLDLVQRYSTSVIGLRDGEVVYQGTQAEIQAMTDEEFKEIYGEEAIRVGQGLEGELTSGGEQ